MKFKGFVATGFIHGGGTVVDAEKVRGTFEEAWADALAILESDRVYGDSVAGVRPVSEPDES